MPVEITSEPGQSNIAQDQGIGAAQVFHQPDLSYLDKENEINAREAFAQKQARRAQLAKAQQKIQDELNVEGKGKTFHADDGFLMDKTQNINKWLYGPENNAIKVAQNDPDAKLKFNDMVRDYTASVNDSINRNLEFTAKQKEINANGGYGAYFPGAADAMNSFLTPTKSGDELKSLSDPNIDKLIQKMPNADAVEREIRAALGKPSQTKNFTPDAVNGGFNSTLTEGYDPKRVQLITAKVLNNPLLQRREQVDFDKAWENMSEDEKTNYTIPATDTKPEHRDLMKWSENNYSDMFARETKLNTTHVQPKQEFNKEEGGVSTQTGTTWAKGTGEIPVEPGNTTTGTLADAANPKIGKTMSIVNTKLPINVPINLNGLKNINGEKAEDDVFIPQRAELNVYENKQGDRMVRADGYKLVPVTDPITGLEKTEVKRAGVYEFPLAGSNNTAISALHKQNAMKKFDELNNGAIKTDQTNTSSKSSNKSTRTPAPADKVVVEKDGKKFNLPKSQLQSAISQGYTLSK